MVRSAGLQQTQSSVQALSELCEIYWRPVYGYIRRRGFSEDRAADLTQGFFTVLLEKHYLADADQSRGRFRSFLLAAVKHFLYNQIDFERAQRRGGNLRFLTLDFRSAEDQYLFEPVDRVTPEALFERRWALTLLDRALLRLEQEIASSHFDRLKVFLTGDQDRGAYAAVSAELGISESALKVAVHRLRKQYRANVRAEIRDTVEDDAQVDDEIRYLLTLLNREPAV